MDGPIIPKPLPEYRVISTSETWVVVEAVPAPGATLPSYSTEEAAGADVRAFLKEPVTILPGKRALIPLGLRVALPPGYEVDVRPRSGLALKHGITVLNSPGTLDSDYRDENSVLLINHGEEPFVVNPGDRIGQWVLFKVERAVFREVETLPPSNRKGGWGSSGMK